MVRVQRRVGNRPLVLVAVVVDSLLLVVHRLSLRVELSLLLKLAKLSLLLAGDLLGIGMVLRGLLVMRRDRQVRAELYPG